MKFDIVSAGSMLEFRHTAAPVKNTARKKETSEALRFFERIIEPIIKMAANRMIWKIDMAKIRANAIPRQNGMKI
jgi:hypothetical protein